MDYNKNISIGIPRLSIIGAGLMALAPLGTDMYLSAFSAIASDLNSPVSLVEMSLSAFFAGVTLGQFFYGPLSDRFGRKIPLIAGLLIFIAATTLCTMVKDIRLFILLRFLQALGASSGMVISQVIVSDVFSDKRKSGQVFSILMLVLGIAPILAPTIGSFMLSFSGWHSIFSVLLVFGIVLILTVIFALPETAGSNPSVKVSRSLKTYGEVIRHPGFARIVLSRSLTGAGLFVFITASPFVYTNILGLSSLSFGLIFGANAMATMAGNVFNGFMLKKYTPEKLFPAGLKVVSVFGILAAVSGLFAPRVPLLMFPMAGFMFGLGMILPSSTPLALSGHGNNTGSASALIGSMQFVFAFAASGIISLLPKGTTLPMTIGVAVCGLSAAAIHFAGKKKDRV